MNGHSSLLRRIRDYVLALVACLAAYLLYAQTVVRWIEPVRVASTQQVDRIEPPSIPNPYEHLFQPRDWELDSPKVLLTSQGTLLFLDYKPLDSRRLEIRPFTLILYSQEANSEQSARPMILRAAEGAILEFDDDVDLSRGQFGRMIGGRVLGEIRVTSPESKPGAGDAMVLLTKNLQIERLRAWTPHEVKFHYGQSHGSGQDLVLNLAPSEQVAGKTKALAIGAVESVQLTQVDELVLQSQRSSLIPGGNATAPQSPQAPVRITCDGPLKFDLNRRVATFDDNVLVQRLITGGPADSLRCQQLAVYLDSEQPAKPAPEKKQDALSSGDVERIVAIGNPVVLDAPSQNAHTTAERLEYNIKTRQVQLKSLKSGAKVFLRRGGEEFTAPELVYEMVPTEAGGGQRLGKLWAPGPGRLVSNASAKTSGKAFAAQWEQEIRIRPDGENQLISLLGGAKIDSDHQGSFQADELHLWVLEGAAAVDKSTNGQAGSLPHMRPDRLLATGHVHADSPQLSADVERLEAWFTQVLETLPVLQVEPDDELSLAPPDGSADRGPSLREPVLRIKEPLAPTEKSQHFHVQGDLIRMQVQQRGKQSAVEQITVEGKKVRITETNAAANEQPLWLAGTRIDLEGGTGLNCQVTVSGDTEQPAILAARGLKLRSQSLQLSRRDNRVTIGQAGDMTLPVEQDAQGNKLSEPRELSIAWQGSMMFDGAVARFRRGVQVRGDTYNATTEELQAHLKNQIDFSRQKQAGPKPEIKRLVMNGGADFENRTFSEDDGRLQAVERLNARSLEIDRSSGEFQGAGPGWLSRVSVGSQPSAGPAPPVEKPLSNSELTYLRVDFREEMIGNLNRRQVEFADQVQAVSGPVQHWDDVIAPQSRGALGERGLVMTADKLGLAEFLPPGAKKGSLEMIATGNTRVEGRDYTAFAHRLTYAAAKSQLVLEGDGRNDAEIKHQFSNSGKAQKIIYSTATGGVTIEGGKSINIGPTTSRVEPPRSPRDAVRPR